MNAKPARPFLSVSLWLVFITCLVVSSLYLSFRLLALVDYGYPLWYEVMDVEQTIATYGPQNHNKQNFQHTDKRERLRLFSAINHSVLHGGSGLAEIRYRDREGHTVDSLLTEAEILHLQDVSDLISRLNHGALLCFALLLVSGSLLWGTRAPQLTTRQKAYSATGLALSAALPLLLWGPQQVFYQLHIWIFPADHPWFFYYQDSLMSTLMQAPNLFAYIAVVLLLVAGLIFILAFAGFRRGMSGR